MSKPAESDLLRPLPANPEAERFILGSILLDAAVYVHASSKIEASDFSLDKNRRIWQRMADLHARNERIDRVTLANELARKNELESLGGLSYLLSLDEGLPQIVNLDGYVRIVRDKALLRRMIVSSQQIIDRCLSGKDDAAGILAGAEESFLKLSDTGSSGDLETPARIIEAFPDGINAFLDPSKRAKGLPSGFADLDELTGGFHAGELFILAARPSMGKTALALNICEHIAMHRTEPRPVAFFSLEMSKPTLLSRLLCSRARVDGSKFRHGYLNATDRHQLAQAAADLCDAPLYIDDSSAVNLMDIHSKLRRLQQTRTPALAVIDYMQLMSSRSRFENRVQEVSALSRGLKLIAKDLKLPLLVLSQLSRAPEIRHGEHKPRLSDLRDSGSIEQDADAVAFIFREEVYKPDRSDVAGQADLILSKQRNGPTGNVKLVYLRHYTRFETMEKIQTGHYGGASE